MTTCDTGKGKRRLPVWMLKANPENEVRVSEPENQTVLLVEKQLDDQGEVKPTGRKQRSRDNEGCSRLEVLERYPARQRDGKVSRKGSGQQKVNANSEQKLKQENKIDGKARKAKRRGVAKSLETSSPESSNKIELTVEDLMSIAEEIVNADKEKQCKASTARNHSGMRLLSSPVSSTAKEADSAESGMCTSSKALTKCTTIGSKSLSCVSEDEHQSTSIITRTGDAAQDMLDLFLGPLLRKPADKEQKMEPVGDLCREVRREEEPNRPLICELSEQEPLMKKKSSLKDKVALFLD